MRAVRIFLSRVRGLLRGGQLDADLRQEIAAHIEEATDEYRRQGLSPAEARRAALRNFGGVAQVEETYREQRSFAWLHDAGSDLRHAARALRRTPSFSLVVLVVLAVGIGAIVSVSTLLNRIVLRPLAFPQSDRLVVITHAAPGLNRPEVGLSSGLYFYYLEHAQSFESIGVYREDVMNLRVPGSTTEQVHMAYADPALLHVLGATPALGRLFTEEDARPGFMNLNWTVPVLLSHDFWAGHLGADPAVVGKILAINDDPRVVVGVLSEGFAFPDAHTQIWELREWPRASANFARAFSLHAVARLRPESTAASAQTELRQILPGIEGVYRDATPRRIAEVRLAPRVTPLKAALIGDVGHVLWTLFGGMAVLLVIACANAAALFTIRAEHRRREIAVRQALGAQTSRVTRLFLTEALVLTIAAAGLGLLMAKAVLWGVIVLAPVELPRTPEIALDGSAIALAGGLAVLMAVFYAGLSVRRLGRSLPVSLLGSGRWATGDRARHWGRDPFIVLQVALALTLMAGSALMLKTYRNLAQSRLGFSSASTLAVDVALPYGYADRYIRFYGDLVGRIGRLPGVESASIASFVPLTGLTDVFPAQAGAAPIPFKFFLPGYFQTMQTPIVEGESFAVGEQITAASPVLVSAALARHLYPGENAVGKTVRRLNEDGSLVTLGGQAVPPFTIVGVVGDVRETTPRLEPTEIVYIPMIDPPVERSIIPTNMTLVVRTQVPPFAMAAAVRRAVAEVDPGLSVGQVRTMDAIVRTARSREAFVGTLLLAAAAVSLFLGVVGIYGSVAHVVRHRTREIGIRLALGARPREVIRMVVMGSMRAVLIGAALGLGVSLASAGTLSALLFDVEPRDPAIFLLVTGLLVLAAMAAALLAAWSAARVPPLLAMGSD